jgi:hypothetical protein
MQPYVTLADGTEVLADRSVPSPNNRAWLTSAMTDPDSLAGLDNAERLACRVAERVTLARARAWERKGVKGRTGAVDAFLYYPDCRKAAFEVTRIASDQKALQLENLLGRDRFEWPLPGRWWWDVWISDVGDLPRLKECFKKVVLLCEAAGVTRPDHLVVTDTDSLDDDVLWLVEESSVSLHGHPDLPAVDGDRVRKALVTPAGNGGMVDDRLSGLNEALAGAFAVGHFPDHVAKLVRTPADEKHLFLIVHQTALRFEVTSALMFGTTVPAGPAWLPTGISHLWLAPEFSKRVLVGTSTGWVQTYPYDN